MRTIGRGVALVFASAALVAAVYWSPRCNLLRSDDVTWIRAVEYQSFLPMLAGQFAHGSPHDYRPMTSVVLWLESQAFGDRAEWYYLVNFLLHAANAALVVRIAMRAGLHQPWTFFAGLLFLIHPAPFRTIVWVTDIATILQATFTLCAVLFWLHYSKSGRLAVLGGAMAAVVAAMFTKESGIATIAVLPALDLLFGCGRGPRRFGMYLVLLAALGVYLVLSLQPLPGWREYPQVYHPGWQMLVNALYGIGFAVTPGASVTVTAIAGAICCGAAAMVFPERRMGLFIAAWMLIAVLPTSPFNPAGYDQTGRYAYSVLCPVVLTAGMLFQRAGRPAPARFIPIALAALALLVLLGTTTHRLAKTPYTRRPGEILYHYAVLSAMGYNRAERFLDREFDCRSPASAAAALEWSTRFVHDRAEHLEFLLPGLLVKGISEVMQGDLAAGNRDFDQAVRLVSHGNTVELVRGAHVRGERVQELASKWRHGRACPQ